MANTITDILKEVNDAYPDGWIEVYFDLETGEEIPDARGGDTLALFIGREIVEVVDPAGNLTEQRRVAEQCLTTAAKELDGVIAALRERRPRR